ncbi:SRPBCC family protein [Nocardia wallacei]|uniref:SRPBCC family protein n=1 Tax=Nocardia wallacei TaxID=480035 RepID=UPI0024547BD0|nr:SRPBCC family protein [Nocardia wallacei]
MTEHSVVHATFSHEREYPATPAQVFAAWSDPETKARWLTGGNARHELDFRVGGRELAAGTHDGNELTFEATYHEIVPGERIAYTSTMRSGDTVTTLSVTTVEIAAAQAGTRLTLTEHGAYLDGHEKPQWREQGTGDQLDALGKELTAGS